MKKETQSEKLAKQNAKANQKHRKDLIETDKLHRLIADGKISAGEALRLKLIPGAIKKLLEENGL